MHGDIKMAVELKVEGGWGKEGYKFIALEHNKLQIFALKHFQ